MKTVNFEISGKAHSMVIPDGYLAEVCASDIIEGKSYPFPDWIKDPRVVLDIGGHAGEFSVLARIYWPKAEIHCYEPNPELLPYLTINAGQHRFEVHEYAVSDDYGKLPLMVSGYGTVANSLVARPNQTGRSIDVDVIHIKEVVDKMPNVVKIDAEGVEVPILTWMQPGMSALELLYVEFHSEADRYAIEEIMRPTHSLFHARIGHKDQGELMYVRRR